MQKAYTNINSNNFYYDDDDDDDFYLNILESLFSFCSYSLVIFHISTALFLCFGSYQNISP